MSGIDIIGIILLIVWIVITYSNRKSEIKLREMTQEEYEKHIHDQRVALDGKDYDK